jgi:citrate lyase beta subunit
LEVASGHHDGALSPFIGIRIKPLTPGQADRALRTLDLFVSSVVRATGGQLPDNFAVTLPKVSSATEVRALVNALELIEKSAGLPERSIAIELMIETPDAVLDSEGAPAIRRLVHAAEERCRALHFDAHDYTAGLGIAAPHQTISHPVCDYARGVMLASMAGSDVWLSDGATNIVPVAPNRAGHDGRLASDRQTQNVEAVHRAWRLAYEDASHSLRSGFYQGWDIHPVQLPARYTAVYSFFLRALDLSSHRLKALVEKAGRASLVGDIFDDAATGQGLLNFFRRAIGCGAITIDEASRTGLSMDELKTASFSDILGAREFEEDVSP